MTPSPSATGSSQQIATLATMTAALVLLVQVGMVVFPGVHPLVIAFLLSMFLATRGLGWRFYHKPVDWVLGACLILSSANGVTNMASNFASASSAIPMASTAPAGGAAPAAPESTDIEFYASEADAAPAIQQSQQSNELIKAW